MNPTILKFVRENTHDNFITVHNSIQTMSDNEAVEESCINIQKYYKVKDITYIVQAANSLRMTAEVRRKDEKKS